MENNKKISNFVWAGLAIGGAALVGGLVWLYKTMSHVEDVGLTDQQMNVLQGLKEEIRSQNGELTTDVAVKILAQINRMAEEIYRKAKPDLDSQRRSCMNNQIEYENLCRETFKLKEQAYNEAMGKVLEHVDNLITYEMIHEQLTTMNPVELERLTNKFEQPHFDGPIPDDIRARDAYLYYNSQFQLEMKHFQSMLAHSSNQSDENFIFFKLLVHKTKVDDLLYTKYKLNEQQIRFLLHDRNLLKDPVIRSLHEQIVRIDEMFTG